MGNMGNIRHPYRLAHPAMEKQRRPPHESWRGCTGFRLASQMWS